MRFYLVAALFLWVPILIDMEIVGGIGPETKFRVLIYGILLGWFLSIPSLLSRREPLRFNLLSALLAVWIVYLLARGWWDSSRQFALEIGLHTASWGLLALLIADVCDTVDDFYTMVWLAGLCQIGPLVLAIGNLFGVDIYLNWILKTNWFWENVHLGQDRAMIWSSLGNPNYYASYGILVVIWLLALLALAKRGWSRALWTLYILVFIITLLFTRTRGIWAGFIPTVFLILTVLVVAHILRTGRVRDLIQAYWKPAVIACGMLSILSGGIYGVESMRGGGPLHAIARRFEHAVQMRDTSTRFRPLMWSASIRMWSESPWVGQGHGRFAPRFMGEVYEISQQVEQGVVQRITSQMSTEYSDQAHNDYLQILAETGAIGFSLFLIIVVVLLVNCARLLGAGGKDRKEFILITASTAACILTSILCIYDFPLLLPASVMFFALGLGGVLFFLKQENTGSLRLHFAFRWLLVMLLLPLCIGGGTLMVCNYFASHWRHDGRSELGVAEKQTDPGKRYIHLVSSEKHLNRARSLFPDSGETLYELGRLYMFRAASDRNYLSRAITVLEQAKETYYTPLLFYALTYAYINTLNYPRAQHEANVLYVINPEREGTNYLAGLVNYRTGRFDTAKFHFERELRVNPDNAESMLYLGVIYEEYDRDYRAAEQMYLRSLEKDQKVLETHSRLGRLYHERLNQPALARRHYTIALQLARALGDLGEANRIELNMRELQSLLDRELIPNHE